MEKKIHEFLHAQKNMTIATCVDNQPYCANCFYAYIEDIHQLVFKSDKCTKHITDALRNTNVGGTILPNISKTGTIKGIQFTGKFLIVDDKGLAKAIKHYYKKYPFAAIVPGEFWAIDLLWIKMTDNTLGFGKKLLWEKKLEIKKVMYSNKDLTADLKISSHII